MHKDLKTLNHLWSEDFVVTNPLNKFVSKRDVIELIESNVLGFTSYDRQMEYVRLYGDTVKSRAARPWFGRERCRMQERRRNSAFRRSG